MIRQRGARTADPRPESEVTVTELGGTAHLDAAAANIRGHYPETGFNVNRRSDMILKVMMGMGVIATATARITVRPGSVVTIEHGTPYRYETDKQAGLDVFMVSSPPWSPDQYEHID